MTLNDLGSLSLLLFVICQNTYPFQETSWLPGHPWNTPLPMLWIFFGCCWRNDLIEAQACCHKKVFLEETPSVWWKMGLAVYQSSTVPGRQATLSSYASYHNRYPHILFVSSFSTTNQLFFFSFFIFFSRGKRMLLLLLLLVLASAAVEGDWLGEKLKVDGLTVEIGTDGTDDSVGAKY